MAMFSTSSGNLFSKNGGLVLHATHDEIRVVFDYSDGDLRTVSAILGKNYSLVVN
jgi:hypothetical protein